MFVWPRQPARVSTIEQSNETLMLCCLCRYCHKSIYFFLYRLEIKHVTDVNMSEFILGLLAWMRKRRLVWKPYVCLLSVSENNTLPPPLAICLDLLPLRTLYLSFFATFAPFAYISPFSLKFSICFSSFYIFLPHFFFFLYSFLIFSPVSSADISSGVAYFPVYVYIRTFTIPPFELFTQKYVLSSSCFM
jgi:hypothetical protein